MTALITAFLLSIGNSPEPSVTLQPGIPVYIALEEPQPLQLAAADLVRDLSKVLGIPSPLLNSLPETGDTPVIAILGPAAVLSIEPQKKVTGPEAHRVFVSTRNDGGPVLVAQGSDLCGAMYAVYTLSEEVLGVPPLWVWSQWEPDAAGEITLPERTDILHPSPYVRWRGWFPNDQDYLIPWLAGAGNSDLLAETMLRLKLNLWDTGSQLDLIANRPTGNAATASRRGLASCSTHTAPLGVRLDQPLWTHFWKEVQNSGTVPSLSVTNRPALETYWRHSISRILDRNLETLWTLTFRATGDAPFWEQFEDAPETDQERAAVISEYIALQKALVEELAGPDAVMRIPMYNEMSDYAIAGLLNLPQSPNVIWNFVSARRDHYPPHDMESVQIPEQQPIGLYFNIQFTSTGSHAAQGEGPWKMEENYRFFDGLRPDTPLSLSLVNSGNTREFPLELAANARMMQNFTVYDSDLFLRTYCNTAFGPELSESISAQYQAFFNAYWEQRAPTRPGFARQYIFHDLRCSRALRDLLTLLELGQQTLTPFAGAEDIYMIDPAHSGETTSLEALISGMCSSAAAFSNVVIACNLILPDLSGHRKTFFNDSLRLQALFMEKISRAVQSTALAVQSTPGSTSRRQHTENVLAFFREAREALRETEHDRFDPWLPLPGARDIFQFDSIEARLTGLLMQTANATVRGLAHNTNIYPTGYFSHDPDLSVIGVVGGEGDRRHHNAVLSFDLPSTMPSGVTQWLLTFRKKGGTAAQRNVDLYGLDSSADGFALNNALFYQGPSEDPRAFATRLAASIMKETDPADTEYAVDVTSFVQTLYTGGQLRSGVSNAFFRLNLAFIQDLNLRRQEIYTDPAHEGAPALIPIVEEQTDP